MLPHRAILSLPQCLQQIPRRDLAQKLPHDAPVLVRRLGTATRRFLRLVERERCLPLAVRVRQACGGLKAHRPDSVENPQRRQAVRSRKALQPGRRDAVPAHGIGYSGLFDREDAGEIVEVVAARVCLSN